MNNPHERIIDMQLTEDGAVIVTVLVIVTIGNVCYSMTEQWQVLPPVVVIGSAA